MTKPITLQLPGTISMTALEMFALSQGYTLHATHDGSFRFEPTPKPQRREISKDGLDNLIARVFGGTSFTPFGRRTPLPRKLISEGNAEKENHVRDAFAYTKQSHNDVKRGYFLSPSTANRCNQKENNVIPLFPNNTNEPKGAA